MTLLSKHGKHGKQSWVIHLYNYVAPEHHASCLYWWFGYFMEL